MMGFEISDVRLEIEKAKIAITKHFQISRF